MKVKVVVEPSLLDNFRLFWLTATDKVRRYEQPILQRFFVVLFDRRRTRAHADDLLSRVGPLQLPDSVIVKCGMPAAEGAKASATSHRSILRR